MQQSSISQITSRWFSAVLLVITIALVSVPLLASFRTVSAAALESSLLTTSSCTGNLLTNPSFENGVTGWSKTSGDTFASMTAYVVDGSYSAYLYRSTGNPARAWQQVNLGSNVAGQTFSLSFYSGTHQPSYSHYAILDFYTASGSYISSSSSVQVDRDVDVAPYTLQQYTLSGVAPANATQVRVTFAASGDYMKLDGACLTKPTSPTATATHTPVAPTATPTNTATPVSNTCLNNLISNPGFENDAAGASPAGWSGLGKVGAEYAGFNTQDGVKFAYITGNKWMWYSLASTAGKSYQVMFYSGSHNPNSTQKVRLTFYNASSVALAQSVHTIVADMETLGQFGGLYTLNIGPAPAGTTELRFEVTDGGNDYAKIDGVCLNETTPPTATPTNTSVPPTATPTNTSVPPTATSTKTSVPPTATPTKTSVPPTATATKTPQPKFAALGNQVWYDLNNNGIQDSQESYVPGVTVELLLGCSGNVVLKTLVTDENGYYLFTKLDSGQYRVRFSNLPAGYTFTTQDQGDRDTHDSDADANGVSQCVSLATSEDNQTVDAGLVIAPPTATPTNTTVPPTATPTNTSVPPTATPTKTSVPPTATPTNTTVPPTVTPTNTSVPPTATPTNTTVPPTVTPTKTSVPPTATPTNTTVPPTSTPTNTPVPQLGSLGNQVWFDLNGNDVQDDGSSFVSGVKVELLQNCAGDIVLATQFTNDNGNYNFVNLPAGDYRVYFSNLPAGYQFTGMDLGGIEQSDSDAGVDGFTACITLAAGEHNPDVDAGLVSVSVPTAIPTATPTVVPALASLGDRVWEDANKNGLQDDKEMGVKNITVELLDPNGTVIKTVQTDSNGNYLFSQLQPGDYRVRFTKPANYESTKANQGDNDASDSDADPLSLETELTMLSAGENDLSWDYGIYLKSDVESPHLPASIGNLVWQDFDQNGVQNDGEQGIGGVTVNLYSGQGTLITTTVTDANGVYWFHHLTAGDYVVEFVPHSGFMMTKDNVGDDSLDSDVTLANNRTGIITLAEGDINPTIDAGIVPIPTGSEQTNEPLTARLFLPLVSR